MRHYTYLILIPSDSIMWNIVKIGKEEFAVIDGDFNYWFVGAKSECLNWLSENILLVGSDILYLKVA